jgi:sugar/nucleoside kinase (ribokinase family)
MALKDTDLLFCNAPESMAVTQAGDPESAFTRLREFVPNCVVTDGPNGAFVRYQGEECHVPAVPTQPKDLTGAGDMFAGAFLYGICRGYSAKAAAVGANFLCHKVIRQVGARLHHGAQEYWSQALSHVDSHQNPA